MKRVLITGAGSYIGTHIAAHLQAAGGYAVSELDMQGAWDAQTMAGCDVVVHVAGIAHQRETAENAPLYRKVNCELALGAARAAKAQGVRQFVFFSSMSVYGLTTGRITQETTPAPNTHYGQSKWEAEQGLKELEDEGFHIAVLRPPMIYGRECRGNYPRLAALARKLPLFPAVQNERSMLHIDALCAFVRCLIDSEKGGLYFPQNNAYVSTCELVRQVAACHGKKMLLVPGFGWLLRALAQRVGVIGKVFGTLTYDQSMSTDFADALKVDFARSIRLTEGQE